MIARLGPLWACLVVFAILAPLAVVIITSFSASQYIEFPPRSLTLQWYRDVLHSADLSRSLIVSLKVSVLTVLAAALTIVPAAVAIALYPTRLGNLVIALVSSPVIFPSVFLALAFLVTYVPWGLTANISGLVVAHTIMTAPFVLRLSLTSLASLPPGLLWAAQSLGANRLQLFRHVIYPLCSTGIMAGLMLAFIVSFDDVTVSLFLARPDTLTLPVRLFLDVEGQIRPVLTAASSLLIVFGLCLALLLERLMGLGALYAGKRG